MGDFTILPANEEIPQKNKLFSLNKNKKLTKIIEELGKKLTLKDVRESLDLLIFGDESYFIFYNLKTKIFFHEENENFIIERQSTIFGDQDEIYFASCWMEELNLKIKRVKKKENSTINITEIYRQENIDLGIPSFQGYFNEYLNSVKINGKKWMIYFGVYDDWADQGDCGNAFLVYLVFDIGKNKILSRRVFDVRRWQSSCKGIMSIGYGPGKFMILRNKWQGGLDGFLLDLNKRTFNLDYELFDMNGETGIANFVAFDFNGRYFFGKNYGYDCIIYFLM